MSNPAFSTLTGVMEIAMNKILSLDPGYQDKLKTISGSVIAISFTDWEMHLFLLPDDHQFTVLSTYEGEVDVKLCGKSWDFFHMGINQSSSPATPVVNSNIRFEGDVATGQKFAQLFSELNIDWEESLADVTGDIIAHRTANIARQAGSWLKEIFNTSQENVTEYLQEELRVTPTKIEIENFYDDLADLRADAERILAKFQLLDQTLNNSSNQADDINK